MFNTGFPPEWSTIKKLIWLVGAGIAGASYIWKTVSGTLIHITDALASPMQKCEVSLEPIQDLHGQNAPYPAGCGVNKFDESTVTFGKWYDSSGNPAPSAVYGCVSAKIPTKSTAYNLRSFGNTPNSWSIIEYASDDSFIKRTHSSGSNPIVVTLDQSTEYIKVQVACPIENTLTAEILSSYKVVLAEGATAPTAYPPYSNICPITGWTGCEVWDDPKYGGLIEWNQKTYNPTEMPYSTKAFKSGEQFIKDHKYYVSFYSEKIDPSGNFPTLYLYGRVNSAEVFGQGFVIGERIWVCPETATSDGTASNLAANNVWIYVNSFSNCDYGSINIFDLTQMFGAGNEPSTVEEFKVLFPKDYYPYNAGTETTVSAVNGDPYQHLSVTFPDSAGTVYGGTVDLVSGVLTVDRGVLDLGSLDYTKSSYIPNGFVAISGMPNDFPIAPSSIDVPNWLCSQYKISSNVGLESQSVDHAIGWRVAGNAKGIIIKDSTYASYYSDNDTASFKTAMSGVQLVYELATPIEIQLTPQEISTLAGENNVWSNTNGDTTLIYKAQSS